MSSSESFNLKTQKCRVELELIGSYQKKKALLMAAEKSFSLDHLVDAIARHARIFSICWS